MEKELANKAPPAPLGCDLHDAACFVTHLFIQRKCLSVEVSLRKPLDIILHWRISLVEQR